MLQDRFLLFAVVLLLVLSAGLFRRNFALLEGALLDPYHPLFEPTGEFLVGSLRWHDVLHLTS